MQQHNNYMLSLYRENDISGPFSITLPGKRSHLYKKNLDKWNQKQEMKYGIFLRQNYRIFTDQNQKCNWNVFKLMSKTMKTRNPNQCRIHHIRNLKTYNNIHGILQHLLDQYPHLELDFSQNSLRIENYKNTYPSKSLLTIHTQEQLCKNAQNDENLYQNQFNCEKKQLATDLTYRQNKELSFQRPNIDSQQYLNQPINFDFIKNPSDMNKIINQSEKYQKQLLQCHNLYLQWRIRLDVIMNKNIQFLY